MKKVTITNAYTWYNKGDAGILLGTVNLLKQLYGQDIEINILSFTPEEDKKRYCKDKKIKNVETNILNPHPYKHTRMGKMKAALKLLFKAIYFFININFNKEYLIRKNKSVKLLNDSDIIIVCGGGFLGGKKFESLMHLFQIYINTKMKKNVYIMGTSIEPIKSKIINYYTEKILKKVDYVFAREKITEKYLKNFLPSKKYDLIPDMAFMLESKKVKFEFIENLRKNDEILVGITVRKWNFPNSKNKEKARSRYIEQIVKFLDYYTDKENYTFIFIPQVIVDYASDVDIAKIIKKNMKEKNKKKFIIREDDWSPEEIKGLIGNLDFFVGTRMHSNIFSTSMCVPTLAIAYEKKTNGIMETVGQDKYVEEIETINAESMITKFDELQRNKDNIQKELEVKINKIREKIYIKVKEVMV